jgi:hypothetical protein
MQAIRFLMCVCVCGCFHFTTVVVVVKDKEAIAIRVAGGLELPGELVHAGRIGAAD